MQISSEFCRTQQADQIQRAAKTTLANVRTIATNAAAAWGVEAIWAERREERAVSRGAVANSVGDNEDESFSDDPDSGFSDQS